MNAIAFMRETQMESKPVGQFHYLEGYTRHDSSTLGQQHYQQWKSAQLCMLTVDMVLRVGPQPTAVTMMVSHTRCDMQLHLLVCPIDERKPTSPWWPEGPLMEFPVSVPMLIMA